MKTLEFQERHKLNGIRFKILSGQNEFVIIDKINSIEGEKQRFHLIHNVAKLVKNDDKIIVISIPDNANIVSEFENHLTDKFTILREYKNIEDYFKCFNFDEKVNLIKKSHVAFKWMENNEGLREHYIDKICAIIYSFVSDFEHFDVSISEFLKSSVLFDRMTESEKAYLKLCHMKANEVFHQIKEKEKNKKEKRNK